MNYFFLGLHFAGNHNRIIFPFLLRLQEETFSAFDDGARDLDGKKGGRGRHKEDYRRKGKRK